MTVLQKKTNLSKRTLNDQFQDKLVITGQDVIQCSKGKEKLRKQFEEVVEF